MSLTAGLKRRAAVAFGAFAGSKSTFEAEADHRPVFVFGFHRGGTTFVQRMLNCSSEINVWGEHAGILSDYAAAHRKFMNAPVKAIIDGLEAARSPLKWEPWSNKIDAVRYEELLRQHILNIFAIGDGHTRWGIKEIEYENHEDAEFLLTLFPGARILLLVRNPVDMFLSQYFVKWNQAWAAQGLETCLADFAAKYRARIAVFDTIERAMPAAMRIDLEKFGTGSRQFEEMIAFLELSPVHFDRAALEEVDGSKIGSSFDGKGVVVSQTEIAAARAAAEQMFAKETSES